MRTRRGFLLRGRAPLVLLLLISLLTTLANPLTTGVGAAQATPATEAEAVPAACPQTNYEIYTMTADGADPTNVTKHPAEDFAPAWSPDGERIAFGSGRTCDVEQYTVAPSTGTVTRLTATLGPQAPSTWSPDGTRLAVVDSGAGNADIVLLNPDGSI